MAKSDKLLSEIQKKIGCYYLSDLHFHCRFLSEQSKAHILAIPLERYSLQEWNAAAAYITGEKCGYQTAEEARARIAVGRE
ncbi:MAG: hypothetical protein RR336_07145 [Oscillospiraceae bacterium]